MANEKINQIKLGNTNYDIEPYSTQEFAVTSNNPSLNWGQTSTIGTIGDTDFKVTMPERPGGTGDHTHDYLPLFGGGTITGTGDPELDIKNDGITSRAPGVGVSAEFYYGGITRTSSGNSYRLWFPEKGGTLALSSETVNLTGYQKIDGHKTFSNQVTGPYYEATNKLYNTSSANCADYYLDAIRIFETDENGDDNEYDLKFPLKNGTFALTSDLSNYVDLTTHGQIISGFKKFTNSLSTTAYCDNDTYKQIWIYTDCIDIDDGDSEYYINFPKKDGTIALTSDLSNYVKKDGYSMRASSTAFKFYYNTGNGEVAVQLKSPTIPTKTSELTNDSNFVTTSYLSNFASNYAPSSASSTTGTSQKSSAALYLVGALSKDSSTSITYINPNVLINTSNQVEASGFYATSDKRLKTNIEDYVCSKSILDLPVKKFEFTNKPGQVNIGCIAQDLQEICPEIVNTNEDGYLSINESKIVYLLLEEVKKLRQELNELKRG